MLSPVAELECADEGVFALGLRSIALWPELLGQLQLPVEFRREGSLLVAHRGDEGAARRVVEVLEEKLGALDSRLRGNDGMRRLEPQELRELEPALRGPAHAWLIPGEGRIHPVQAMQALAAAASGVQWHWGRAVDAVHPGELHTSSGTPRFDHVFDVRGTGARPQLAVRGVRGEIFWLHAPGVDLRRPVRLLHPRHRVYLVPREGDLVVVGASEIESEGPLAGVAAQHRGTAGGRAQRAARTGRGADRAQRIQPAPGPARQPAAAAVAARPDPHQRAVPPRLAHRAGAGGAGPAGAEAMNQITVNGEPRRVDDTATLADLVAALGQPPAALATAVNGEFVPRSERAAVRLREGDAVFTFQPITGG
jgi:thiamine biosynthesis protein ThiS